MARMALNIAVSEDRQSTVIRLLEDERVLGHIVSDADALSNLIHELGECRARMAEPVTRQQPA